MKGFILAAGEGRRLRPYTNARPKPMIELHGTPLLEFNVRALVQAGVSQIFINTHYYPDVIKRHFGDGGRFGVAIRYSHEPELLGTAGALLTVADSLDERFILLYGDNLTDCDLKLIVARHERAGALATIALFERADVGASGIVGIDADDIVLRFLEKPNPADVFSHWVNAGIMIAEPAILTAIPAGRPSDFGRDILPALIAAGERIAAYRMHEHLWWIDSVADYERAQVDIELRRFATANRAHDRAGSGGVT